MLSTSDKNEILKMIKASKEELRKDTWQRDSDSFDDRLNLHTDSDMLCEMCADQEEEICNLILFGGE